MKKQTYLVPQQDVVEFVQTQIVCGSGDPDPTPKEEEEEEENPEPNYMDEIIVF